MKIGVISDTHGIVPAWHKAMSIFGDADLILHAGDILYHPPKLGIAAGYDIPDLIRLINSCPIPIVIARGNCDPDFCDEALEVPISNPQAFVQFEGLRIVVRHGHNLSEEQMLRLAGKHVAQVIVTGHTHIPMVEQVEGALHINPGSPAYPLFERGGAPLPTIGLISEGSVRVLELASGREIMSMPLR